MSVSIIASIRISISVSISISISLELQMLAALVKMLRIRISPFEAG